MTTDLLCRSIVSDTPSVLGRIHDADCNLAIWERSTSPVVEQMLDGNPRDVRTRLHIANFAGGLSESMNAAGFQQGPARDAFEADVAALAARFREVMKLEEVEARIEIVTTDSCRKWHADYVSARLITTYFGEGTQWLDAKDAAKVRNGDDPSTINEMSAGDVGLFKGKLATAQPAIHRSPPIASKGSKRLLFVLNPPEES